MSTPLNKQTVERIWFDIFAFPAFFTLFVLATFALGDQDPNRPRWYIWAVRGGVALFTWFLGWMGTVASVRELKRRGCRLPRIAQWPGLFTVSIMLVAAVGWVVAIGLFWVLLRLCGLAGA